MLHCFSIAIVVVINPNNLHTIIFCLSNLATYLVLHLSLRKSTVKLLIKMPLGNTGRNLILRYYAVHLRTEFILKNTKCCEPTAR
jgi:hypothetical protein